MRGLGYLYTLVKNLAVFSVKLVGLKCVSTLCTEENNRMEYLYYMSDSFVHCAFGPNTFSLSLFFEALDQSCIYWSANDVSF
mmetsp:Transcript_348/g.419  ORF Transcript_348/g.419 Transcript_348/m.419 type:complete len:82 (-) Transcript_348:225-470(-)